MAEPVSPSELDVAARLDVALVQRGLARSRTQAQTMITSGEVSLNGVPVRRAAAPVRESDVVCARLEPYASRAAYKLLGALEDLDVTVPARALDAGAAHGGFTQVLLEKGCRHVIAVDVGHGQLTDALRRDPRVVVWEQTNLRELSLAHVAGRPVDLVVADVSFISLTLLVGPFASVLRGDGAMLLMIKPQFEVGRDRLGRGGIVHEAELRGAAVQKVLDAARQHGWTAESAVPSRVPGSTGNQEYFVLLRTGAPRSAIDVDALVGKRARDDDR